MGVGGVWMQGMWGRGRCGARGCRGGRMGWGVEVWASGEGMECVVYVGGSICVWGVQGCVWRGAGVRMWLVAGGWWLCTLLGDAGCCPPAPVTRTCCGCCGLDSGLSVSRRPPTPPPHGCCLCLLPALAEPLEQAACSGPAACTPTLLERHERFMRAERGCVLQGKGWCWALGWQGGSKAWPWAGSWEGQPGTDLATEEGCLRTMPPTSALCPQPQRIPTRGGGGGVPCPPCHRQVFHLLRHKI